MCLNPQGFGMFWESDTCTICFDSVLLFYYSFITFDNNFSSNIIVAKKWEWKKCTETKIVFCHFFLKSITVIFHWKEQYIWMCNTWKNYEPFCSLVHFLQKYTTVWYLKKKWTVNLQWFLRLAIHKTFVQLQQYNVSRQE